MSSDTEIEPTLDLDKLSHWLGKQQSISDTIRTQPVAFMRDTLDLPASDPQPGDPLPHAWHWLFFLDAAPLRQLSRDGHAARGGFLPPVALPRRMWAGGRLRFLEQITIGEKITRVSTIKDIARKTGRSGELCFVTVQHQYISGSTLKLWEEHDIVYREDPVENETLPDPPTAPQHADHAATICPSSIMLFRYSALTFNGHRIHYDLDYCRQVEGYPGLIVHGPLTATLLIGMAGDYCSNAWISTFEFRAVSPLFDDQPFTIALEKQDQQLTLWAANSKGKLAMSATASV